MKKMFNGLQCTRWLLVVFSIILFAEIDAGAETVRQCVVKFMVGTVKVRKGKNVKWRSAKLNMKLKSSDAIRTYIESQVEIEMDDGSVVKVKENSIIEISDISENTASNAKKTKIRMMYGELYAKVKKMTNLRSSFVFETPTATAAIRGTEIGLEVNKNGTRVKVYKGTVFVIPKAGGGKGVNVGTNQMTIVKKGQKQIKIMKLKHDESAGDTEKSSKDTTYSDTTADALADSVEKETVASLFLKVLTPADNDITTGGPLLVTGKTLPEAKVKVKDKYVTVTERGDFNITLQLPVSPGTYGFDVIATLGTESKSVSRTVVVKLPSKDLTLIINSPKEGEIYKTTSIPVSGVTTPGAEVTVGGNRVQVSSVGDFNSVFFIPDETGDYDIGVEAVLGEALSKSEVISIKYEKVKTPLTLTVTSPANGIKIKTPNFAVSGNTTGKEVDVNGSPATVVNGQFLYYLKISETRNWDLTNITVTASNEEEEKTEEISVTIDHTSLAFNTSVPVLTAVLPRRRATVVSKVSISIMDNTPDDEITFISEVDGERQTELYNAKDRLVFTLLEGMHKYRFYAIDMAGNRSNIIVWEGALISKRPYVLLRNPASGIIRLTLPPDRPGGGFIPRFNLEFEIKNLPDDNYELLKDIRVTNDKAGYSENISDFSDVRFSFDVDLARNGYNDVKITVTDKADNIIQKQVVIDTRN